MASHFVTQGHQVLNCKENADTQIVREALDVACRKENVTVVAEDRHFSAAIVLLEHRNRRNFHDIRTKKEAGKKLTNVRRVAENLNYNVIKNLLFIHACSVCDTTSAILNQGKTALMKFIANNNVFPLRK